MVSNELFRMVSLRQSKRAPSADGPQGAEEPPPDPRLRHRATIEGQAKVGASPRETILRELKSRHADTAKKVAQLENVQRAVFRAYTQEHQDEATPKPAPLGLNLPGLRRTVPTPAAGTQVGTGSIAVSARFTERVTAQLNEPEKVIFQDVLKKYTAGSSLVLADWMNDLATGWLVVELNNLCSQIRAIEENDAEALPTVTPQLEPSWQPIVAAVGWGDSSSPRRHSSVTRRAR